MNRYVFIPGKNPNLSLAELASWFDCQGIYFRVAEQAHEFFVIEAEKAPEADNLGGMIKVCRLIESFDRNPLQHPGSIFKGIPAKYLPSKRLFGLSVYPDSRENSGFFNSYATSLKKSLRDAGVNSKFMPVPKDRSALTHVEVIKKKLEEVVVCRGKNRIHVASTLSVHNPFEFQKRDVGRPKQRPMLSIPPRLARIMVNLSRKPESRSLLDPFCGIGTILQEASLMGLDILGTDIDEPCIVSAIENLYWLSQDYRLSLSEIDKKIMKLDVTKLSKAFNPESIDLIVTEPFLGPALKIYPDQNRAEAILRGLRSLFEKSLKEFSFVLKKGGRACIVFPRFEFSGHFAHLEAEKLAAKAGLRPVNILKKYNIPGAFPYVDKEPRHKTIREIWVFEKPYSEKPMPKPPVDIAIEKGVGKA
jgi:tRNA G10  N-methylase Trm11